MVLETVQSFWKSVSKDRFPKLKDFAVELQSMFGNKYVCESTFSTMKQIKYKKRNRMADETLEDIFRLAITNTGIDKVTTMSEKPWPQASHW